MSRLTWRREPKETGLRRVYQGTRGYELRYNQETIITVSPLYRYWDRYIDDIVGWYWVGLGRNTCQTPCSTPEEAKIEAKAYAKEYLARKKNP